MQGAWLVLVLALAVLLYVLSPTDEMKKRAFAHVVKRFDLTVAVKKQDSGEDTTYRTQIWVYNPR